MGEKITSRLADLGAFIYAVEKDEYVGEASPNIERIRCDVSDWDAAYKKMLEIGPVHGLVNNAGVAFIESFFDMSQESWDK